MYKKFIYSDIDIYFFYLILFDEGNNLLFLAIIALLLNKISGISDI